MCVKQYITAESQRNAEIHRVETKTPPDCPQTVKTASSRWAILQISFRVHHDDYCVVNPGPPRCDVPAFVVEQVANLARLHRNDHYRDDTKARASGSFT